MRVEWSIPANADLKAISEHIEHDRNLETANRIVGAVFDAIQSLGKMPYRGRPGRNQNTREMVVPGLPYIIIYRVSKDRVAIVRIVHGTQKRP